MLTDLGILFFYTLITGAEGEVIADGEMCAHVAGTCGVTG